MDNEKLTQALHVMASSSEEEKSRDPRLKRYHELPSYPLTVTRDGSDQYIKALTDAILNATIGGYGSIDYKGYKIYYTDTPYLASMSLEDGHKEYSYEISFQCDALSYICFEEYRSEEERLAFIDPENDMFIKTIALLDKVIENLDDGTWIKERKKLNIFDFKDYSGESLSFKRIEWDERTKNASGTFSYLLDDALSRAKGHTFTESDFDIFADVIRRMAFFARYGKRNYMFELQGYIWFEWKPTTKRDKYIWRCMDEFGQGDLPDRLLDNCTMYYFVDDPKGWEALAYLLPIASLWEMCMDYEPDNVQKVMFGIFDLVPDKGYRQRIEKLLEEDKAKETEGESAYDQEDI